MGATQEMQDTLKLTERPYQRTCPADGGKDLTFWQAVRRYPRIMAYCLGLCSAILLYGYDFVIIGTVSAMPQFQRDFGDPVDKSDDTDGYAIPSSWLAIWHAASPIGIMFGAFICGSFQDRFGRKVALATGSFFSALSVLLDFLAYVPDGLLERREMFLAGKLFQGGAIGMVLCTTQTYMSEVLPPRLRGPVISFFPIFTLFGHLLGAMVIYTTIDIAGNASYRVAFASQWPFSALPIIMAIILPESPTWFIKHGRLVKALQAQRRLDIPEVNSILVVDEIRLTIEAEREVTGHSRATWAACFKGTNLRRTLIVSFSSVIPQLFGLTLISNTSYFLQTLGLRSNMSIMFLFIGLGLGMLANMGGIVTLNFYGRRISTVVTLAIAAIIWLCMAVAGCFRGMASARFIACTLMLLVVICSIGAFPASYVIASETSSLDLRSKTQAISWIVSGLFAGIFYVAIPYVYDTEVGNLGGKTCFIFVATSALAAVLAWLYIPEMKGRTAHEIDLMFSNRVPTRQFTTWESETGQDCNVNDSFEMESSRSV